LAIGHLLARLPTFTSNLRLSIVSLFRTKLCHQLSINFNTLQSILHNKKRALDIQIYATPSLAIHELSFWVASRWDCDGDGDGDGLKRRSAVKTRRGSEVAKKCGCLLT